MASPLDQTHFRELIQRCDAEIRKGKSGIVETLLRNLELSQIPRSHAAPLAQICRRAGLYSTGLKILTRIVRPAKKSEEPASEMELCEYAALLARIGSAREALSILSKLGGSQHPETHLQTALTHIMLWDYTLAIPGLREYLRGQPDAYAAAIAKVNLAACLIFTSAYSEALVLLEEIVAGNPPPRVKGNCLELRTQVHIAQGHFSDAKRDLKRASEIFSADNSYDRLFVDKWHAVIAALESSDTSPMDELLARIRDKRHWNSLREIDFFSLKIRFDQRIFDKLYFGSPFDAYRERLLREFGREPSETLIVGSGGGMILDVNHGSIDGHGALNSGKKIHHLLIALTRDLYSPATVAALFFEIHPSQHFDIFSSPARIHQLIYRCRDWLKSEQLPLSIDIEADGFQLTCGPGIALKLNRGRQFHPAQALLAQLELHFGAAEFSVKEAIEKCGLPRSSTHRNLKQLAGEGLLEITKQQRQHKYRLNLNLKKVSNL